MMLILSGISVLETGSIPDAHAEGFFFIERPKLGLGTFYKFEDEHRTVSDTKTEFTNHDLLEKVTVGSDGWVYHPNLMEYHLTIEPQWRQESFKQTFSTGDATPTRNRDTSILAYNGSTTLFKQKPISLDFFGDRNTRQIDISRSEDTEIESETIGARLKFTNPVLPASIGVTNRQFTQSGFYESEGSRDAVTVRIQHNIKKSVTELNLLHDDTDRTTRTAYEDVDTASTIMNGELTNTFFFTGDDHLKLTSLLYINEAEYDEIKVNTRIISENFFWTHNKNLLTRYTFDFNRRDVDGFETEKKAFNAFLIHRLENSLTTNLGAGAEFNDFAGGGEDRYRSNLGFIYRKPIPWGNIELGSAFDYEVTQRDGSRSIIPVEARYVLSNGTETYLDRRNVVEDSIVVTDLTGAVVYTKNVDYRIDKVGSLVRISRTLLGAIADGQRVAVNYSYHVDSGYDDSRFGQNYRCSLGLWSFLLLTYTQGRNQQDILSGDPPEDPQVDTYRTLRVRIDTKWSETQFLYDRQDRSYGNGSTTRSIRQLINIQISRSFFFNFSGDIGDRDFQDINKKERFYSLGTSIGWTPRWWCHFDLLLKRDSISGDQQDMRYTEISPILRLVYGVWTGIVSYRLRDQEDHQTGDSLWRQEVSVTVNRRLW